MEHRTGEKSAVRIAIESGAPILRRAETWAQLYRDLAGVGMRYEKTGSGATVFVGDTGVKASSVDRQASLSKLQKRLGPYEPPAQPDRVRPRTAEPIKPMPREWDDYIAGRKAHYAAKTAARRALEQRLAEEMRALSEQQRAQRTAVLRGRWRGLADVFNALRSVIAAEQAAEKASLKEKHRAAREQHRQAFRSYADFKLWQRIPFIQPDPAPISGERDDPPAPRDIRAFKSTIRGREVYYTRKEIPEQPRQPVSFVDRGKRINVFEWRDEDTTLAALQLASQKWGRITVNGSDEYKRYLRPPGGSARFQDNEPGAAGHHPATASGPPTRQQSRARHRAKARSGNRSITVRDPVLSGWDGSGYPAPPRPHPTAMN